MWPEIETHAFSRYSSNVGAYPLWYHLASTMYDLHRSFHCQIVFNNKCKTKPIDVQSAFIFIIFLVNLMCTPQKYWNYVSPLKIHNIIFSLLNLNLFYFYIKTNLKFIKQYIFYCLLKKIFSMFKRNVPSSNHQVWGHMIHFLTGNMKQVYAQMSLYMRQK